MHHQHLQAAAEFASIPFTQALDLFSQMLDIEFVIRTLAQYGCLMLGPRVKIVIVTEVSFSHRTSVVPKAIESMGPET
jgi:hypothetical protein